MKKQAPMPGKSGGMKLKDAPAKNKNASANSPSKGQPKGAMTKMSGMGKGFGKKKGQ